jgi:hypothetical protein
MQILHPGEKRRLVGLGAGSSDSAIGPFALVNWGWNPVSAREDNPVYRLSHHKLTGRAADTRDST